MQITHKGRGNVYSYYRCSRCSTVQRWEGNTGRPPRDWSKAQLHSSLEVHCPYLPPTTKHYPSALLLPLHTDHISPSSIAITFKAPWTWLLSPLPHIWTELGKEPRQHLLIPCIAHPFHRHAIKMIYLFHSNSTAARVVGVQRSIDCQYVI